MAKTKKLDDLKDKHLGKKGTEKRDNYEEETRSEILAERIKMLFGFCAQMIPDLDLMKKAYLQSDESAGMALSAAPLLGAHGIDYEEKNLEHRIKRDRAKALHDLVKTLKDTEDERIEFAEKQKNKADILKHLGL